MTPQEMIKGRWYHLLCNDGEEDKWILKFDKIDGDELYDEMCASLKDGKVFNSAHPLVDISEIIEIKEASIEEVRKWFPEEAQLIVTQYEIY